MKKTVETPENSEDETEIAEEIQPETDYFSEQNDENLPKSQTINTLLINDTDFSNTDFNDTKKIIILFL